jgi:hypothetical protein
MARTFDGVDDQIAFGSEAAIDDVAVYTAFALIRITGNVVDERTVLSKFKSDYSAGKLFISLAGNGVSNNKVFTLITTSAGSIASESAADVLVVNTWRAIVTTWDGTVNVGPTPKIYAGTIGGAIAEVSYTSQDDGSGLLTSLDASASLRVGTRDPLDTFFAGGLAECALWNRVLTADEIRALGRGFAPAFFPRGRVFYSLIDGRHSPEINMAGTTHGTVTGTTFLDHPPVIYPRQMGVQVPTVGGSSFKAAWARGSNVVIGSGTR